MAWGVLSTAGPLCVSHCRSYSSARPRVNMPCPMRKLRNCPTERATANLGRIPLTYLPNSPILNGRRILFTLLFFWPFGN